jgi:capsular exopolysaccharide synthesis family protein
MDLRGYLAAIRRSWWLVVVLAILGAATGGAVGYRATAIYAAHLTFYVSTPNSTGATAYSTDQVAQNRANSYALLVSSDDLAQRVISTTGLALSSGTVAAEISGTAQLNTTLVNVTVKDPSPARALAIARAVGTDFPTMAAELERGTPDTAIVAVSVTSGPSVGSSPVSPRKKLEIVIGLGAGLLVGLAVAVIRALLDTSVRTAEDLTAVVKAPVVGSVGFDNGARRTPLVVGDNARSARGEAFRQMRTNLQFIDAAQPARVVVVTSSVEGEGKSTTAANLAVVYADGGAKVLLIDADLRRPKIADYLGIEGGVGLASVLAGHLPLADAVQQWGTSSLSVLASGPTPPNPSELLGSPAMRALLSDVRARYDLVIIDTPPVLPVTDASLLAAETDGAIVVFRHGKTKRGIIEATVRSLRTVNVNVLGCVLNMRPRKDAATSRYDSYHYREPSSTSRPTRGPGARRAAGTEPSIEVLVSPPRSNVAPVANGSPPVRATGPEARDATSAGVGEASRHGQPELPRTSGGH